MNKRQNVFLNVLDIVRDTHGSGTTYHNELAKQLEIFLREQLKVCCFLLVFLNINYTICAWITRQVNII